MSRLEIPARFRRSAKGIVERTDERALPDRTRLSRARADRSLRNRASRRRCGTKFTDAFLNDHLPIKRYVGVDVYGEMIEFLREAVDDPRFEYHHLHVRNALYNPDAPPMTTTTDLGIGAQTFDLIWLFSVFTHLDPEDFRRMMLILRRYVRDTGTLFFTAFLNERSPSEHGATEALSRAIEAAVAEGRELPPALVDAIERSVEQDQDDEIPAFVDLYPEQPLMAAMYSRAYAFDLIDGTGWNVETVLPPNEFAQHQFVCRPV